MFHIVGSIAVVSRFVGSFVSPVVLALMLGRLPLAWWRFITTLIASAY